MRRRRALVIGGSSGIGLAVAHAFVDAGHATIIAHHPTERPEDLPAEALAADIAREDAVTDLFGTAVSRLGGLDIVVNTAALARYEEIARTDMDVFDAVFSVNARGAFMVLRAAARNVADGGRIVSFSSGSARAGAPKTAAYAGSKAAVEQFTRALATELAPRAITVNAVAPGFTDTPMLRSSLHIPEAVAAGLSPFGRLGSSQDVAAVVTFLCSHEAGWVTGQTIQAGGGVVMS